MTAMHDESQGKTGNEAIDLVPLNSGSTERPSRDAIHKILVDEKVDKSQWGPMKTLGGLQQLRDTQRGRDFGENTATHPTISQLTYSEDPKFSKFARIVTVPHVGDDALTITITVFSNLEHMADPYDLVPVTLESDDKTTLDTIAVLTLTPDGGNICTFDACYTYAQLARLLKLDVADTPANKILEKISGLYPELGVKAQWFTSKNDQANSANHTSGGILEKDGSGKIRLRHVTATELKATEQTQRNTEWNAGELLHVGRPVYDAYRDVLREGKQLATTLEAESEYLLSTAGDYKLVLGRMKVLYESPEKQKAFGIVRMKDEGTKEYIDTYYDVPDQLTMLRNMIVLRRRSVHSNDPVGTVLFSVKGPSLSRKNRSDDKIRLAAQVQLLDEPGELPEGRLKTFISDSGMTDNAFARVLMKGLDAAGAKLPQQEWALYPALVLTSNRVKYSMELDNSTTVEFSADAATATYGNQTATLYAIEFGVGHPGLVVNTTAAITVDAPESSSGAVTPTVPRITRPYHVPEDLTLALFNKPDYLQFTALRDQLLPSLVTGLGKLTLGGNKASTLAQKLKMF
jgi:hypothetical protein